jgi:type III secretion system YscJ/HrcJ family lipoprotein
MLPRRLALSFSAFALTLGCTTEVLHHDLREDDANQIIAALHERGISAHKVRDADAKTFEVTVRASHFAEAVKLTRALSLPKPMIPETVVGGLIPGPEGDRAQAARTLSAQISNALMRLRGVVLADVVVALPDHNDLSPATPMSPSASVVVQVRASGDDALVATADVQRFVAAAIPELGLKPERVAAIVQPAPAVVPDVVAESPLESVLGIRVAVDSADALKLALGGMATLVLLLSFASSWLLVRLTKRSARAA